jgi:putative two-component system response regulator
MSKATLLVVEDNLALREALREILSFDGYAVITASNGVDALEKMTTVTPDFILSDIAMPQMDGYAFFQAVRSRPEWMVVPFVFLTARGEKEDILRGKDLGAEDYLIKPLTQDELLTAVHARLERSNQIRVASLRMAYESSLTVLANAIEVRDVYTQGHVERVVAYAMLVAAEMGLQGRLVDQLRLGAILHDIGKIIIRGTILFKEEPLTEADWQILRTHATAGSDMIRDIEYLAPVIPVIRHHHERWDGQGYPDRLVGDDIPLPARIIAVADSFDAMTTRKPYKDARSLEQAFEEILRNSGKRYDPGVVKAFERAWQAGKIQPVLAEWAETINRAA